VVHAARVLLLVLATVLTAVPRAAGEDVPAAPPAIAEAAAGDRELQRKVEAGLDRCIGAGLSWGHYEGQFKEVLALGPGVPRVLLKLFTTPHAIYAFAHDFADHPGEDAVDREQRTLILQRLAGDALGAAGDRSLAPALAAFVADLERANPDLLRAGAAQQDACETAAVALLRLGDPVHFERRVRTLRAAAGATVGADGALQVDPAPDREGRYRQWDLLARLASLHARDDNLASAERAYQRVIDMAGAEIRRLQKAPEPREDWPRPILALRGAHYNIACLFAQRGRVTDALRNLRRAVDFGYLDVEWLSRDRDLDPIREDPGFAALLVDVQARLRSLREAAKKELERSAEPKPPKGD
jgi:hypothetical protein